ncbi:MAG: ATP-binding cassette domain-containing protein [Cyclobacteriaceae bacterium]|nr:ATP-binding cassette domain-containing protein [Cyclobacteriaceae bacterium]MCH8516020.1 ATP-binding cassette domain-containing protein [Cyclobacteriaceae bacterium]
MAGVYDYRIPIKRLISFVQLEASNIYGIFFYALLNGSITLVVPLGLQAILNFVLAGRLSTSLVLLISFVIVALLFSGFLQISQLVLVEKFQQRIFPRAALEFAYRIPRFKFEGLYGIYPPEMMNRFFDTINLQKAFTKLLTDFTGAILQIFFSLLLLSVYHPVFIAFSIFIVILVYLLFRVTTPRGIVTSLKESSAKYNTAYWLEEMARTLGTFKLAGYTPLPIDRIDKLASKYLEYRQSHFRVLLSQYYFMIFFKVFIIGALLIIGTILLINEEISLGQFVAAEVIIALMIGAIEKLILSLESIYDSFTAIEKMGHITDLPLEKQGGRKFDNLNEKAIALELNNVSFKYPGEAISKPIFENINLKIDAGEKVVITGKVGGGKSTLLQLMAGLYSSYEGKIFVNDLHLNLIDIKEFRSHIGDSMSQQNIFHGTIRENIVIGRKKVSEEDLDRALRITGLVEEFKNLEEGVNTMIQPQGNLLKGDVVRKIILARSFCHNPRLLLLESPIVDLNPDDKRDLLDYIFSGEWTMVASSDDDELLKRADRVIELYDGSIVFDGSYEAFKDKNQ